MPDGFAVLDSALSSLSGAGTPDEKIDRVQDCLVKLVRQFRYTMENIDAGRNLNPASLEKLSQTIAVDVLNVIPDNVATQAGHATAAAARAAESAQRAMASATAAQNSASDAFQAISDIESVLQDGMEQRALEIEALGSRLAVLEEIIDGLGLDDDGG